MSSFFSDGFPAGWRGRFHHQKISMCETITIQRYSADCKTLWDEFVGTSKNGTFLFRRDYMDYHRDRIKDFSLLIYSGTHLAALLPASEHGDEIRSHGGLTYGGLVMSRDISAVAAIAILKAVVSYYSGSGYKKLVYRPTPYIYHRYPSDEDIYALFRCGAGFTECNVSSVIDLSRPIKFNQRNKRYIKKAVEAGLTVAEYDDFSEYWVILTNLLMTRYNTGPVHTIDEIMRLKRAFPDNIRLFCACDADGEVQAGVVVYCCGECIHCQYIASTDKGKANGALPLVFSHILSDECGGARYFDFGTSNENHGLYLNEGLLLQKNGMGGRAVAYSTYTIDLNGSYD